MQANQTTLIVIKVVTNIVKLVSNIISSIPVIGWIISAVSSGLTAGYEWSYGLEQSIRAKTGGEDYAFSKIWLAQKKANLISTDQSFYRNNLLKFSLVFLVLVLVLVYAYKRSE